MKIWAAVLLLAVSIAAGAATKAKAQGLAPYGAFDGGKVSYVDVSRLQAHIVIPMIDKAGRGLRFVYPLQIDSANWHTSGSGWIPFGGGGGTLMYGPEIYGTDDWQAIEESCTDPYGIETDYYNIYVNYSFTDPHNITHYFNDTATGQPLVTEDPFPYDCDPSQDPGYPETASALATDGSGFALPYVNGNSVGEVLGPDGTQYDGILQDRNGNQITDTGGRVDVFTDTLGVQALTIDTSVTGQITYKYPNPQAGTSAYVVTYTAMTEQSNFGCGFNEYSDSTTSFPTLISLPDGQSYHINWEPTPGYGAGYTTGRIAAITLPTGGQIVYNYPGANDGANCSTGTMAALDRITPDGTTHYTASGNQVTVADPQSNETVYTFDGTFKTERQVFDSSHNLLLTEAVCYDGYLSNCPGSPDTHGVSLIDDRTTLPNGLYRDVLKTMDATAGAPSQVQESGSWTPTRITTTSYLGAANWPGLPTQIRVTNGSATESQINFTYDEQQATLTTGTPQHVTGGGGNATTVTYTVGNGTTLSKHFTYFDTGNVETAKDFNGGITTYVYNSTGCPNSFPTEVQEAVTGLTRQLGWNCAGGVQNWSQDENGQGTTTTYADANYWRPSYVTMPDGSVTDYTYPSASQPNTVETVMNFNGGNSTSHTLITLDSMGRKELAQKRQSPTSTDWDSVETIYDSDGRAYKTSLPYSASPGSLAGTEFSTTIFDALGRPTSTTDAKGGYTDFTYNSNDVLVTRGPAPAGGTVKRRQIELDSDGRVASVCELTTGSGSGTCGQTTAQTGYWTQYLYNTKGQLTQVTQNAQGSPQQTRTFVYDDLGRMTSETTPEGGTTAFSFDAATSTCSPASPGDLVQRQDAAGNITCYSYDLLHRLVLSSAQHTVAGFDGRPDRHFVYDSATVDSQPMAYAEGRLAEAYTGTPSSKVTDLGFSYTVLGQAAATYQQSSGGGAWRVSSETYWANGQPDTLSLPGAPVITYAVDGEGRPAAVGAAGAGQQPVTSSSYSPLGLASLTLGSQDGDSYVYDAQTGRMTQYSFSVNGVSDTGVLTWNLDGSLQKLAVNDLIAGTSDTGTCTYGQDDLGRLDSASCPGVSQTFSYDPFGNVTTTANPGLGFAANYNQANNRISSVGNITPTYDADGNLTQDPVNSGLNSVYDTDGEAWTFDGVNVTYDALGRAVMAGGNELIYGPSGAMMAVMSATASTEYVPLPGGGTAVYSGATLAYYRHADRLGSSRLATTPNRQLYASGLYAPYGQIYRQTGGDVNFTGQNQLCGNNQYNFPMRNFSPVQGRWWTPDPAGKAAADPRNPQSWNRYAYVGGTPLATTDPLGLDSNLPPCENLNAMNQSGNCEVNVAAGNGTTEAETIYDFDPYMYCALYGCNGGPPEMTVDGACGSYGCTAFPADTGSPDDTSGGGGGVYAGAPGGTTATSSTSGIAQNSLAATCSGNLACYWFDGATDAMLNGSLKGLGIAAAATSTGVLALAASGLDAIPEVANSVGSVTGSLATGARYVVSYALTNPEIIAVATDVLSNLAHRPGVPSTGLGLTFAVAHGVQEDWDKISGWMSGW